MVSNAGSIGSDRGHQRRLTSQAIEHSEPCPNTPPPPPTPQDPLHPGDRHLHLKPFCYLPQGEGLGHALYVFTFVSQPLTVGLAAASTVSGPLAWTLMMFCRTLIQSSRMLGESAVR